MRERFWECEEKNTVLCLFKIFVVICVFASFPPSDSWDRLQLDMWSKNGGIDGVEWGMRCALLEIITLQVWILWLNTGWRSSSLMWMLGWMMLLPSWWPSPHLMWKFWGSPAAMATRLWTMSSEMSFVSWKSATGWT